MPLSKPIVDPALRALIEFAEDGIKAAEERLFGKSESRHYSEADRENFRATQTKVQQLLDSLSHGPRLAVEIGSGAVKGLVSNLPLDVLVLDYDVDSVDEDALISVPDEDGSPTSAQAMLLPNKDCVDQADLDRLAALFSAFHRGEPAPAFKP
jgi:GrpB-like predicted nucleotidyltransferase (UPF0157 family)